jgi:hypothetical protein
MTSTNQQKAITKTVAITLLVIATILALFFHKITTPRYLSVVELKINGLVLLSQAVPVTPETGSKDRWSLIASTDSQAVLLTGFEAELKSSLKSKTQILRGTVDLDAQLRNHIPSYPDAIAIINRQQQLVGYLKPPYDQHKMLLTYASVLTHR